MALRESHGGLEGEYFGREKKKGAVGENETSVLCSMGKERSGSIRELVYDTLEPHWAFAVVLIDCMSFNQEVRL